MSVVGRNVVSVWPCRTFLSAKALSCLAGDDDPCAGGGSIPATIDLGVEVFADLLTHLEAKDASTAAGFGDLVRRRRQDGMDAAARPEAAALLRIVDELSPAIQSPRGVVILLGSVDDARV